MSVVAQFLVHSELNESRDEFQIGFRRNLAVRQGGVQELLVGRIANLVSHTIVDEGV